MEIELGEYYRTKNGKIHKWSKGRTYIGNDEIVKHSKNIIDLVKVGDYANGRLVLQVDYKNKNVCLLISLTDTKAITNIMWYGYEDIKSIVTHEQMASIEYKVEEDKYECKIKSKKIK